MKKIILFCFSVCTLSQLFAQDNVSVYYGRALATFKYLDSQGNKDPNMGSEFRANYGINFSKVFNSGFFIRPEVGYKNLGAVSELYNQKLSWSLHYIDFNLGLGVAKKISSVTLFVGVSPYVSHLYKAYETIGSDEYNLLTDVGMEKSDYGVNLFGGIKYQLSEAISIYAEVSNTTGLMQLEKNSKSGSGQELYNRAIGFELGLSFNIVSKRRMRFGGNF